MNHVVCLLLVTTMFAWGQDDDPILVFAEPELGAYLAEAVWGNARNGGSIMAIDADGDGLLRRSEALAVNGLLRLSDIPAAWSLEDLAHFPNVRWLELWRVSRPVLERLPIDGLESLAIYDSEFYSAAPINHLKSLEMLGIYRGSLGSLYLGDLPGLERLLLRGLGLEVLRTVSLPALKHLDVADNALRELPALPAVLEGLWCPGNQLTALPELGASLRILDAEHNLLSELPDLPVTIEEVYCANNRLETLPSLPGSLRRLRCDNNRLESLPELPASLSWLECTVNFITEIPSLPETLEVLMVSVNRITELPPLPDRVHALYCHTNQLTRLPDLPTGLTILYAQANRIEELEDLPPTLTTLSVDDNRIARLPEPLPALLDRLTVSGNPLIDLPALPSRIATLEAARCRLEVAPDLSAVFRLYRLDLSHNLLHDISAIANPDLPSWATRFIDLSGNLLDGGDCDDIMTLMLHYGHFTYAYAEQANGVVLDCFDPGPPIQFGDDDLEQYLLGLDMPLTRGLPFDQNEDGLIGRNEALRLTGLGLRGDTVALEDLSGIEHFRRLHRLVVEGQDQLRELPDLSATDRLRFLEVGGNGLTRLLGLPESLERLTCRDNELETLPSLPRALRELDAANNRLTSLPAFEGLTRISTFDVRNNLLTELPDMSGLFSVWDLNVADNRLEELPAFHPYVHMGSWDFSGNRLIDLAPLLVTNRILLHRPHRLDVTHNLLAEDQCDIIRTLSARKGTLLYQQQAGGVVLDCEL